MHAMGGGETNMPYGTGDIGSRSIVFQVFQVAKQNASKKKETRVIYTDELAKNVSSPGVR